MKGDQTGLSRRVRGDRGPGGALKLAEDKLAKAYDAGKALNRSTKFMLDDLGKQDGDGTGFNVSSLQDVGRQALASLACVCRL